MKFIHAFLFSLICIASCQTKVDNKNAIEDKANIFFQALKDEDYQKALNLCSKRAFEENSKETWINSFKEKKDSLGKLTNFKKYDMEIVQENNFLRGALVYEVRYQKSVLYERLIIDYENHKFKIIGYEYFNTKEEVDNV